MANDEKGSPGRYEDEHHIKHHIDDDMPLNPCCQTSHVVYYWATYELPCSESPCLFLLREANKKKIITTKDICLSIGRNFPKFSLKYTLGSVFYYTGPFFQ